jgi:hypothetical protein
MQKQNLESTLEGLALRTRPVHSASSLFKATRLLRAIAAYFTCDVVKAKNLLPHGLPSTALQYYWHAKILITGQENASCEHLLQKGADLCRTSQQQELFQLEEIRFLSFRFRFDEALNRLAELFLRQPQDAVLALAESCLGDILQNARIYTRPAKINDLANLSKLACDLLKKYQCDPETTFRRASRTAKMASQVWLFRKEQKLKLYEGLAIQEQWKRLRAALPENHPTTRLPKALQAKFLRLQFLANSERKSNIGNHRLRKLWKGGLDSPTFAHLPDLLQRAKINRAAVRELRLKPNRELEERRRLLKELIGLDKPVDGRDRINRTLIDYAEDLFSGYYDLALREPQLLIYQYEEILEFAYHQINVHHNDIAQSPSLTREMKTDLMHADPNQALDDRQQSRQKIPLPDFSSLGAGPALILLKGETTWHIIRQLSANHRLEHTSLPFDTLSRDATVMNHKRLGELLFRGFAQNSRVLCVVDDSVENIPFFALPMDETIWGSQLLILQCACIAHLHPPALESEQETVEKDKHICADQAFAGIESIQTYFNGEAHNKVLHISGHGKVDPKAPQLSFIYIDVKNEIDVGDIWNQAAGRKLLVLDSCQAGELPAGDQGNDLGLCNAGLLGGAEVVFTWSKRVLLNSSHRQIVLGSLYSNLQTMTIDEAIRSTLRTFAKSLHANYASGVFSSLSSLRIMGRMTRGN